MSPKSLLRHPECISDISEFTSGGFNEIYDDTSAVPGKIKKVLFCTGKIYYDLLAEKKSRKLNNIALVRVEQLYPFPEKQLNDIFKKYKNAKFVWVQEEPENMGAWLYFMYRLRTRELEVVCRKASASPATGFLKKHKEEQDEIINKALEI
jgi:2-oxoglutarate dehydrogenase E1 component